MLVSPPTPHPPEEPEALLPFIHAELSTHPDGTEDNGHIHNTEGHGDLLVLQYHLLSYGQQKQRRTSCFASYGEFKIPPNSLTCISAFLGGSVILHY